MMSKQGICSNMKENTKKKKGLKWKILKKNLNGMSRQKLKTKQNYIDWS